mmetsp:Transcript_21793/g.39737  ORF Transcript_21793/g.39737 Transcript_21793/m.39737 type:complete len:686 (+) Transcript_21793:28-2085(+)
MAHRLRLLEAHLTTKFGAIPHDPSLSEYRKRGLDFDPVDLRRAVDGNYMELMQQVQKVLTETGMTPFHLVTKTKDEQREYIVRAMYKFKQSGLYTKARDDSDPAWTTVLLTALAFFDVALGVRFNVHSILYGDTIRALGTEKHNRYLERVYTVEDYGCFALTELGHGSNASGVETIATYIEETRQIELHSPTQTSAKWWIGAAGKTANMSVVFAQFYVGGVNQGVHVFLVPVRDLSTHEFIPGVVCGDCGPKAGLDGIDNGFLLFTRYRVNYDCLLDKHGHVTTDGKYKSKIASKEKRFASMLAGLARGRLTIVKGTEQLLRSAVTVAIRYGAVRRQFGKSGEPETPILDYPLHRYRLTIHLARSVASSISFQHVLDLYASSRDIISANPEGQECAQLHAVVSALKPITTFWTHKGVQECREACGGLGYSAFSMLSHWRNVNDVNLTWEGDNNVLIQQSARYVLKEAQNYLKGKPISSPYLKYLNIDSSSIYSLRGKVPNREAFDLELSIEMFHYRVNLLLQKSLTRLQENVGRMEMQEAWNATQAFYLQELGKSFGEVIVLEEFVSKAHTATCPKTKVVLRLLAELLAYYSINETLVLFREHDYLTAEQAIWLQDHLLNLSEQVGESSVKIVDAIAFTDPIVGSVLGRSDGQVYKNMIEAVEASEGVYDKPSWLNLLRELRGSR